MCAVCLMFCSPRTFCWPEALLWVTSRSWTLVCPGWSAATRSSERSWEPRSMLVSCSVSWNLLLTAHNKKRRYVLTYQTILDISRDPICITGHPKRKIPTETNILQITDTKYFWQYLTDMPLTYCVYLQIQILTSTFSGESKSMLTFLSFSAPEILNYEPISTATDMW